jgi:hypothetical protein
MKFSTAIKATMFVMVQANAVSALDSPYLRNSIVQSNFKDALIKVSGGSECKAKKMDDGETPEEYMKECVKDCEKDCKDDNEETADIKDCKKDAEDECEDECEKEGHTKEECEDALAKARAFLDAEDAVLRAKKAILSRISDDEPCEEEAEDVEDCFENIMDNPATAKGIDEAAAEACFTGLMSIDEETTCEGLKAAGYCTARDACENIHSACSAKVDKAMTCAETQAGCDPGCPADDAAVFKSHKAKARSMEPGEDPQEYMKECVKDCEKDCKKMKVKLSIAKAEDDEDEEEEIEECEDDCEDECEDECVENGHDKKECKDMLAVFRIK